MRSMISILLATVVGAGTLPAQTDTLFHSVIFSGKTVAGVQKTWQDSNGLHLFFRIQ